MEGKRWREICGERISCGRGEARRVGRRDCRIRRAEHGWISLANYYTSKVPRGEIHTFSQLQGSFIRCGGFGIVT